MSVVRGCNYGHLLTFLRFQVSIAVAKSKDRGIASSIEPSTASAIASMVTGGNQAAAAAAAQAAAAANPGSAGAAQDYNSQYWQYYQNWSQYAAWSQYSQQYPEYVIVTFYIRFLF